MTRIWPFWAGALLAACGVAVGTARMGERKPSGLRLMLGTLLERKRSELRLMLGTLVPQVYTPNPNVRMEDLIDPKLLKPDEAPKRR